MIDYSKFYKALKLLESQYGHYRTRSNTMEQYLQEALAESVIQRFETCYDCMWKVLKRYLDEELGFPDVPNSPKGVLRKAFENQLLSSPIEQWFAYVDARIGTAHDYSGEKAQDALDIMENFVDDAIGLYQTLADKTWS